MELDRRAQVYYLMKSGITEAKTIHKKTRIPLSTIYDIKNRIKSGEGIEMKPGTRAREKLSTTD